MNRRPFALAATLFLVAGAIAGCASGAETGSVGVEIRAMPADAPGNSYTVSVLGPDEELVSASEVTVGSSFIIEDVPLGWVTVAVESSCTVETELSSQSPTMQLTIDAEHCRLTS